MNLTDFLRKKKQTALLQKKNTWTDFMNLEDYILKNVMTFTLMKIPLLIPLTQFQFRFVCYIIISYEYRHNKEKTNEQNHSEISLKMEPRISGSTPEWLGSSFPLSSLRWQILLITANSTSSFVVFHKEGRTFIDSSSLELKRLSWVNNIHK